MRVGRLGRGERVRQLVAEVGNVCWKGKKGFNDNNVGLFHDTTTSRPETNECKTQINLTDNRGKYTVQGGQSVLERIEARWGVGERNASV